MAQPLRFCCGSSQMKFSQGFAGVSSCTTSAEWMQGRRSAPGLSRNPLASAGEQMAGYAPRESQCLCHSSLYGMPPSADKAWVENSTAAFSKGHFSNLLWSSSAHRLFQTPGRLQQWAACHDLYALKLLEVISVKQQCWKQSNKAQIIPSASFKIP